MFAQFAARLQRECRLVGLEAADAGEQRTDVGPARRHVEIGPAPGDRQSEFEIELELAPLASQLEVLDGDAIALERGAARQRKAAGHQ